jgi:t-SNARE complex subunit (syntaxin)
MKVRVAYTVDYEDVPNVVNDLLVSCRERLKRASQFKFNILNLEKTTVEVAELQKDLDTVSTQLEDCLNLSHGYINVQKDVAEGLEAAVNNSEEVKNEEDG